MNLFQIWVLTRVPIMTKGSRGRGDIEKESTRTGTRTQDQLIKSQLLYQLSYPRIDFLFRRGGEVGVLTGFGKLFLRFF